MNETSNTANPLAKWREENKGIKAVVLSPADKAKANPRSKVLAIRAFCFDCCGGVKAEVTLCPSKDCSLWLHRPWQKETKGESEDETNYED